MWRVSPYSCQLSSRDSCTQYGLRFYGRVELVFAVFVIDNIVCPVCEGSRMNEPRRGMASTPFFFGLQARSGQGQPGN